MKKKRAIQNKHKYLDFVLQKTSQSCSIDKHTWLCRERKLVLFPITLLLKIFYFLKNIFVLLRLAYYELLYFSHLRVRYIHDHLYQKNKSYKKVNDYKYTRPVRRATILGFVVSFFLFQFMGSLWPEFFNPAHPKVAEGANSSVIWTTKGNFDGTSLPSGAVAGAVNGANPNNIDLDTTQGAMQLTNTTQWNPGGTTTTNAPGASTGHTAVWTGSRMIIWGGGTSSGGIYDPSTNLWILNGTATTGAPTARSYHTAVWTGTQMVVWGGVYGTNKKNDGGIWTPNGGTKSDGSSCNDERGCWIATSSTNVPTARYNHTVVWTGARMIVWGGDNASSYEKSGSTWTPKSGTKLDGNSCNDNGGCWESTNLTGAPTERTDHTAVWDTVNGKMIVWGGHKVNGTDVDGCIDWQNFGDGSSYDPEANGGAGAWTALPSTNAPAGRYTHTAIWTGSKMIVWGGHYQTDAYDWDWNDCSAGASIYYNNGSFYDPAGNGGAGSWTALPASGLAGRQNHTAIWTGSKMIVWGGSYYGGSYHRLNDGSAYDPSALSWTALSSTNVPVARENHTAIWTDSKMIVWGGYSGVGRNDGGVYGATYSGSGIVANTSLPSYRIDAGSGQKAKWSSVNWSSGSLLANTDIKFQVRTSDDNSTWSAWSSAFTQSTGGSTTGSGDLSGQTASRYLEIQLTLDSLDGLNTPTLNDFTVSYDTLESPSNVGLTLTKTDDTALKTSSGTTVGAGVPSAWTSETSIKLTATGLTCTGCGTSTASKPEVEIKPVDNGFTGTPTTGTSTNTGDTRGTFVPTSALSVGNYHLQVRTIDAEGRASGWTSYGGNAESEADFSIDGTKPPAVTSSISSPAPSTSLSFSKVTDTGGSGVYEYKVYRSTDGTLGSNVGNVTSTGADPILIQKVHPKAPTTTQSERSIMQEMSKMSGIIRCL